MVSHYGKLSFYIRGLISSRHPNANVAPIITQHITDIDVSHAWGCIPNQEQAVQYLSMAASNSAEVEKLALGAGMKKGGAAKGELVLAMYELANCFRNGWGIKKDPAAAKQYYETAANLGDTDAMNEVAWCYTEGFGTKKDKVSKIPRFLSPHSAVLSSILGKVCVCFTGQCRIV
jgi:TPR repeat protein